jgi:hypothetical protein
VTSPGPLDGVERWQLLVAVGVLAGVVGGIALGTTVGVEYGLAGFLLVTAVVVVPAVTWKGLALTRTNV